jgi:hypothetical protein
MRRRPGSEGITMKSTLRVILLLAAGCGAPPSDPPTAGSAVTGTDAQPELIASDWDLGWLYGLALNAGELRRNGLYFQDLTPEGTDRERVFFGGGTYLLTPTNVALRVHASELSTAETAEVQASTETTIPLVVCLVGDDGIGSCFKARSPNAGAGNLKLDMTSSTRDWLARAKNVIVTTEANWNARATGKSAETDNVTFRLGASRVYVGT